MIYLKFGLGALFFLLGLIYLYKSDLVLGFYRFARESVFNDRALLLKRKKLAVSLFCLSLIATYMGFSSLAKELSFENERRFNKLTVDTLMHIATEDYLNGKFANALAIYKKVLDSDPENIDVLKRVAYTYFASGDKKKALATWKRISEVAPRDREVRQNLRVLNK